MGFEISVGGFFEFLTRPLTNPIGWILLAGAGFYIYLKVTGKIQGISFGKGGKGRGGQQQKADYVIK